jgi:hypothetical protein
MFASSTRAPILNCILMPRDCAILTAHMNLSGSRARRFILSGTAECCMQKELYWLTNDTFHKLPGRIHCSRIMEITEINRINN